MSENEKNPNNDVHNFYRYRGSPWPYSHPLSARKAYIRENW